MLVFAVQVMPGDTVATVFWEDMIVTKVTNGREQDLRLYGKGLDSMKELFFELAEDDLIYRYSKGGDDQSDSMYGSLHN